MHKSHILLKPSMTTDNRIRQSKVLFGDSRSWASIGKHSLHEVSTKNAFIVQVIYAKNKARRNKLERRTKSRELQIERSVVRDEAMKSGVALRILGIGMKCEFYKKPKGQVHGFKASNNFICYGKSGSLLKNQALGRIY